MIPEMKGDNVLRTFELVSSTLIRQCDINDTNLILSDIDTMDLELEDFVSEKVTAHFNRPEEEYLWSVVLTHRHSLPTATMEWRR